MLRYPGDEYVEITGFDDYSIGTNSITLQATIKWAKVVSRIVKKHKKSSYSV